MRTGALRWTWSPVPRAGDPGVETWLDNSWEYSGMSNVWTMFSADLELGYVYLPTGAPTNDMYGGHRPGNNLYANSLVCVDAETGERVWHFQTVHHDLWDYDNNVAPILMDITVDGREHRRRWCSSRSRRSPTPSTGSPASRSGRSSSAQCPGRTRRASGSRRRSRSRRSRCRFDRHGIGIDDLIDFTPELKRAEA